MKREYIVRATAGTLVLASLTLGHFVHPGFFYLTAFVGLNLLQSSFSGFCPLEMLLEWRGVGRA